VPSISVRVHDEFERLQAVIRRQICHERRQRPRRGCRVREQLRQIRPPRSVRCGDLRSMVIAVRNRDRQRPPRGRRMVRGAAAPRRLMRHAVALLVLRVRKRHLRKAQLTHVAG
jgi:hypothetical protein